MTRSTNSVFILYSFAWILWAKRGVWTRGFQLQLKYLHMYNYNYSYSSLTLMDPALSQSDANGIRKRVSKNKDVIFSWADRRFFKTSSSCSKSTRASEVSVSQIPTNERVREVQRERFNRIFKARSVPCNRQGVTVSVSCYLRIVGFNSS